MMYEGSQTHLHSLAGEKGGEILLGGEYIGRCNERDHMDVCVCASGKCVFYTDLPYFDFTCETLSSVPIFCKFMVLCYAFPFTPGLTG